MSTLTVFASQLCVGALLICVAQACGPEALGPTGGPDAGGSTTEGAGTTTTTEPPVECPAEVTNLDLSTNVTARVPTEDRVNGQVVVSCEAGYALIDQNADPITPTLDHIVVDCNEGTWGEGTEFWTCVEACSSDDIIMSDCLTWSGLLSGAQTPNNQLCMDSGTINLALIGLPSWNMLYEAPTTEDSLDPFIMGDVELMCAEGSTLASVYSFGPGYAAPFVMMEEPAMPSCVPEGSGGPAEINGWNDDYWGTWYICVTGFELA